jgi:hypothetical protein
MKFVALESRAIKDIGEVRHQRGLAAAADTHHDDRVHLRRRRVLLCSHRSSAFVHSARLRAVLSDKVIGVIDSFDHCDLCRGRRARSGLAMRTMTSNARARREEWTRG